MKAEKQKITKDTSLGELVEKYPQVIETLMGYGLHCIGCHASQFETLEQGFKAHGMGDKDVEEAVKRLNKALENKGCSSSGCGCSHC